MKCAFDEGVEAFQSGERNDANPFCPVEQNHEFWDWDNGWHHAQQELQRAEGPIAMW